MHKVHSHLLAQMHWDAHKEDCISPFLLDDDLNFGDDITGMLECEQMPRKVIFSVTLRCIVVVVVALLFYVHGKHLRSCRDGQLT